MDAISAHPNVGPFIGAQLIQRLVASNPSPAYVARVAAVFADDGLGARGNLKAVTRAVLLDPEARFPDLASPHWGKVREPILRFSGWARAFGARSSNGAWAMPDTSDNTIRLAQSPMRAPSVFNFFRRATRPPPPSWRARGLAAPELQITDETSIAGYLNFLAIYADRGWEDLQTDYAAELALAGDPDALVAHVALLLAGDAFSEATARRIATALRDIPPERRATACAPPSCWWRPRPNTWCRNDCDTTCRCRPARFPAARLRARSGRRRGAAGRQPGGAGRGRGA